MTRVIRFLKLPFADCLLISEAFMLLGLARAAIIFLPFRWLVKTFGKQQQKTIEEGEKHLSIEKKIRRVAWAVRRASRQTPWRSNCLTKAVAGRYMLRRRHLTGAIYFGLLKNSAGEIEAHAWLKSNNLILTGGSDVYDYVVVANLHY